MKNTKKHLLKGVLVSLLMTNVALAQNLTTSGGTSTTGTSSFLCVAGSFANSGNINTASLTDWTDFTLVAGVGCSYWIHSSLNGNAGAGTYAGFHVRAGSLATVLSGLQVQTFQGGTLQETASGGSLASIVSGGEGDVYFHTTKPYNEVQLSFAGLLSVGYDLDVFYGFGTTGLPNTSVLPLQFKTLNAQRKKERVAVNFDLSSDESLDAIALERSADGRAYVTVKDFSRAASGQYHFEDMHPNAAYYRVKVATRTKAAYSPVVKVKGSNAFGSLQVVVKDGHPALLMGAGDGSATSVTVCDAAGHILFAKQQWIEPHTPLLLPLTLRKGQMYFTTVTTGEGEMYTQKFVL
jgi:hypothetical protein